VLKVHARRGDSQIGGNHEFDRQIFRRRNSLRGRRRIAQDYPTKPIRVIVPLTPGSGADIAGRIVAKYLGDALKQAGALGGEPPGAGGIIGTQAMLNADADGYTLMVQSARRGEPRDLQDPAYDPLRTSSTSRSSATSPT